MEGRLALVSLTVLLLAVGSVAQPVRYDDFHYPSEEPAERAAANLPRCKNITRTGAVLLNPQTGAVSPPLGEGEWFGPWQVLAVDPSSPFVALERNFARWGLQALIAPSGVLLTARKGVGSLQSIVQPRFNLSDAYFANVTASLEDLPTSLAAGFTADGQLTYAAVAATLAPQRDVASISNEADVVKFVVTHSGRIKCASRGPNVQGGGITELQDQHAPPPNNQTVVFDPAEHTSYWPQIFEHSKSALVGEHFGAANVGAFSPSVGRGFELLAFSPILTKPDSHSSPEQGAVEGCQYSGPYTRQYVAGNTAPPQAADTLEAAEDLCTVTSDCGGITFQYGKFNLRAGSAVLPDSTHNTTSWLLANPQDCRVLPRLPGINYRPSVLIRFREQQANQSSFKYFRASNSTNSTAGGSVEPLDAASFYQAFLERHNFYSARFGDGMRLQLPVAERRQQDMARAAMVLASNVYVGEQPNYGFGATYWSYGREDNGSLPLDTLAVDGALLEWGHCKVALGHVGFFFDNYVRADGSVNYYQWTGGDSISDLGRLIDMYLSAVRNCRNASWAGRYLPAVVSIGAQLLNLRQAAAGGPDPGPCCRGLLRGAPEHDFSGDTSHFYFNNNVWALKGLQLLGAHLTAGPSPLNASFGAALLNEAALFAPELAAAVNASAVRRDGGVYFLPPYAVVGATPYDSMTESRDASYTNFRFWSEAMLAEVLPGEVEQSMLQYHNHRGGRVGGASRWQDHLDDMPTVGWGYGALRNNQTDEFHALLYGHMASYQSRGTFHSTEQLSYLGSGRYRQYLHWADPSPDEQLQAPVPTGSYYAPEQDISYCVVSQMLVSKLTRWMLVFDDKSAPDPRVWLARAAPHRWFPEGFAVRAAPCLAGDVSYQVQQVSPGTFAYNVTVAVPPTKEELPGGTFVELSQLLWSLSWPGQLTNAPVCDGCSLAAVSKGDGVVTVRAAASAGQASFRVVASVI